MNKRYIDFVPSKRGAAPVAKKAPVRTASATEVTEVKPVTQPRPVAKKPAARPVKRPAGQRVVSDMVRRPDRKAAPRPTWVPKVQRAVKPTPRVRRVTQVEESVAVQKTTPSIEEAFIEENLLENPLLDDPLERPVSEFTDLEELAQEIAEVTQNEPVLDAEELRGATEAFSLKQEPQYGVVENFQPRFLQTEVEKRPLSPGYAAAEVVSVADGPMTEVAAKAPRNARQRATGVGQINASSRRVNSANLTNANNYGIVSSFGSDTAAGAKNTAPEKAPKAKKGHKIGMILAVIGTMILGAAVGTVAFLLLPR